MKEYFSMFDLCLLLLLMQFFSGLTQFSDMDMDRVHQYSRIGFSKQKVQSIEDVRRGCQGFALNAIVLPLFNDSWKRRATRLLKQRNGKLAFYLFVYLFVCLFVCLFVYLFACLLVCLFACLLVCLYTCLLAYLLTCLLAYLLTCLLVYLFIYYSFAKFTKLQ